MKFSQAPSLFPLSGVIEFERIGIEIYEHLGSARRWPSASVPGKISRAFFKAIKKSYRKLAGFRRMNVPSDIKSGTFDPPDGRGFKAFASTALGRANPGRDASGPFYAGIDEEGRLIVVRPRDPASRQRTVLPLSVDPTRRAIYAADTPDLKHGWIFFIKNEKTPGSALNANNAWFELHAVSLAEPSVERTIVRQPKPDRGMPPLDVAFARFIRGTSKLTFGMLDEAGRVQVAEVDMEAGDWTPRQVTFDPLSKVDPYGFTYAGREWLIAGIAGTATSQLYSRPIGSSEFEVVDRFGLGPTMLERPALAQSHERRANRVYYFLHRFLIRWSR